MNINQTKSYEENTVISVADLLSSVSIKGGDLILSGRLEVKNAALLKAEVAVVAHRSDFTALVSAPFENRVDNQQALKHRYTWTASIHLDHFSKKLRIERLGNDLYSLRLILHTDQQSAPVVISLSLPSPATMDFFHEARFKYGKQTTLVATLPSKEGFLQLSAVHYESSSETKEKMRSVFPGKKDKEELPIWIIGNSCWEPGENSWAFFETIQNDANKEVYYILSPDSPAFKSASKQAGNHLLSFLSPEYFEKMKKAEKLFCEKSPFFLFPSVSPAGIQSTRAEIILIPEDPLGLSNEEWTFNQSYVPWKVDGLCVSSKTEKRFAKETLGFNETKILLSGLPNQEQLALQSANEEKILLLLPETGSMKRFDPNATDLSPLLSLSKDEDFRREIAQAGMEPLVLLTEEDAEQKRAFQTAGIKVKTASSFEKSYWLAKAAMIITDSHPAALTFSSLERPVLFLQPEQDYRYSSAGHSLKERRYQNELPGEIAGTHEQVIHLFRQLQETAFSMSRKNRKKAKALFEFGPSGSVKRLMELLEKNPDDSQS